MSGSTTNLQTNTTIGTNSSNTLTVNAVPEFKFGLTVSSGTVSFPNNTISMSAVNGLTTKVVTLESDIASIKTKHASDKSELQLQINTISLTPGPIGAKGDKGDTGATGSTGATGATGAT